MVYRVCGELCYLSGAVIKDKTGKPEPQIPVSFCRPEDALPAYKERWTIETMFKGLKSSGFNIEDTHMVHINRIEQLFGVVIIAYTWAYLVGIEANIKVKAIRVLNNGRRAISLVMYLAKGARLMTMVLICLSVSGSISTCILRKSLYHPFHHIEDYGTVNFTTGYSQINFISSQRLAKFENLK